MKWPDIAEYQFKTILGRGNFSTVYLVHNPQRGEDVALKIIPSNISIDAAWVDGFKAEIEALQRLRQPAILPVVAVGKENGLVFLEMPYMPGGSLKDRLGRHSLSEEEAKNVIDRLANALDAAHAAGIIHGDLKPANVLFDSEGKAFLSDFGMSRLVQACASLPENTLLAPPAYLGPEQARPGVPGDKSSDNYALGVLLYEMLTADLPYRSTTALGYVVQHLFSPVPAVNNLKPEFNRIIQRAMAKIAADRYATAGELAQALATIVDRTLTVSQTEIRRVSATAVTVKEHRPDLPKTQEEAQPKSSLAGKQLRIALLILIPLVLFLGAALGISFLRQQSGQVTPEPTGMVIAEATGVPEQGTPPGTAAITPSQVRLTPTPSRAASTLTLTPLPPTQTAVTQVLTYPVVYTDTLFDIAAKFQVSLIDLQGMNSLECDQKLAPPKVLLIPPSAAPPPLQIDMVIDENSVNYLSSIRQLECMKDIADLEFSPDGSILAVASGNSVYLWDTSSWKPLARLAGLRMNINAAAFSPRGDYLAAGDNGGQIGLWEVSTGKKISIWQAHNQKVTDLTFKPFGSSLVSASTDQRIIFWDVPSGKQAFTQHLGLAIYSLVYSPDHSSLAVGLANGVRLYNADGNQLVTTLQNESGEPAYNLAFSPDGNLLASSSDVWQVVDRLYVYVLDTVGDAVSFSQGNDLLFVGSQPWRIRNGEKLPPLISPLPGTPGTQFEQESLAMTADGKYLAWGTHDGVSIWAIEGSTGGASIPPDGKSYMVAKGDNYFNIAEQFRLEIGSLLDKNKLGCTSVPFVGQPLRIPDATSDIKLPGLAVISSINVADLTRLATLSKRCAEGSEMGELYFSPDGNSLISGQQMWRLDRNSVLIQELGASQYVESTSGALSPSPVLVFSPDGRYVAARSGKDILLYDAQSGVVTQVLTGEHTGNIAGLAFSNDGNYLASAGGTQDKKVVLWSVPDGKVLSSQLGLSAKDLLFSQDDQMLITAWDDAAWFWSLKGGKLPHVSKAAPFRGVAENLVFSPNHQLIGYIICCESQGAKCVKQCVKVYDRAAAKQFNWAFNGYQEKVQTFAFSPDSKYLAVVSDFSVLMWDIFNDIQVNEFIPDKNRKNIRKISFSPDGKLLLVYEEGDRMQIWDANSGEHIFTMPPLQVDSLAFNADQTLMAVLSGDQIFLMGVPK